MDEVFKISAAELNQHGLSDSVCPEGYPIKCQRKGCKGWIHAKVVGEDARHEFVDLNCDVCGKDYLEV